MTEIKLIFKSLKYQLQFLCELSLIYKELVIFLFLFFGFGTPQVKIRKETTEMNGLIYQICPKCQDFIIFRRSLKRLFSENKFGKSSWKFRPCCKLKVQILSVGGTREELRWR